MGRPPQAEGKGGPVRAPRSRRSGWGKHRNRQKPHAGRQRQQDQYNQPLLSECLDRQWAPGTLGCRGQLGAIQLALLAPVAPRRAIWLLRYLSRLRHPPQHR